jgi:ATP-dependent protease Clp ATPase subunit
MSNQSAQKQALSNNYLNPDLKSPRAQEFEDKLSSLIVGQDRAVRRLTGLYQIYLAGLAHPGRPLGTMLFLGPTGSGKTRVGRGRRPSFVWRSQLGDQD